MFVGLQRSGRTSLFRPKGTRVASEAEIALGS